MLRHDTRSMFVIIPLTLVACGACGGSVASAEPLGTSQDQEVTALRDDSARPDISYRDAGEFGQFDFQTVISPADPTFTQLLGINDRRIIAGYHTNTPGNKGFTLELPNQFTDENFPASAQTQVVGINDLGRTVGFYIDQAGNTHGFQKGLQKSGWESFITVDMPGTTFNQLLGVNNEGQQAGYFQDAVGLQHAYIHENRGSFLVLGLPMPSSQATSVNDEGVVVGFEQTSPAATTSEGYILRQQHLTVLQFPGSTFTQALGINNREEVVGLYNDANGNTHGFEYHAGKYVAIDAPGGSMTVVNGINNEGWIVGFFQDPNQGNNTIGLVGRPRK